MKQRTNKEVCGAGPNLSYVDPSQLNFPHIGLTQKTPESITRATLKEPHIPHLIHQVEAKLPPIFKIREKQSVNNNFPFSVHDNRYSFENSVHHFETGLGRKKTPIEKRQHISKNFNLWACDFVPSCLDGFSNNQISYVYKEGVVVPFFRRFPKHHSETWNTFKCTPECNCPDATKKRPKVRFAVDKKATSPLDP
ncbi:testis-expressed protein 36 [Tenrec ecaudatus]|uniref:testis-expressed protein 36 n=1 Tax=Tenrec ecaudatus TaxID=94439 RepID=UPI003F5A8D3F